MKTPTLLTLWAIAIALATSILLLKNSQNSTPTATTARAPGQPLLTKFSPDQIATIELSGPSATTTTLTKKASQWTVSQRQSYPANTRSINHLLRTLADLKVTQSIQAGPSLAPRFGMDETSSDPELHGITASFKDPSGKNLATLSFGKNLDPTPQPASPLSSSPTGRFIRNHADTSAFYAVSELFESLTANPRKWLDDEFLKIEKIQSITLTQPASPAIEWKLTRPTPDAEFTLTDAYPGVKIDPATTAPLKSLFSSTRFEDVLPTSETSPLTTPEKLQTAVLTTFAGPTYTLTIQPTKTPENPPPSTPPTFLITVTTSGEKPENTPPALTGRTFLVSAFTVAPLLKSRTDLILKTPTPTTTTTTTPATSTLTTPTPPPTPPAEKPPTQ